jgi:hypothetical protein
VSGPEIFPERCHSCGAPRKGSICEYCGTCLIKPADEVEEREALDAYHFQLGKADKEGARRLLRSGFVPDYPEVLVEAGLRVIPLVDNDEVSEEPTESAVLRLQMIVAKLRLERPTVKINNAVRQFDEVISGHRKADRHATIFGLLLIGGLLAGVAWLIWKLAT